MYGQFVKDFSTVSNKNTFGFFALGANDRGYGHPAVCGSFTVALRQSECGRKACEMHVSQQVTIGVCYLLALVV